MEEYTVAVNGIDHTFQLDDEDAKRMGLKATDTKAAEAPANKSRKPANKGKA